MAPTIQRTGKMIPTQNRTKCPLRRVVKASVTNSVRYNAAISSHNRVDTRAPFRSGADRAAA